jgi:hypothetical protein
VLVLELLVPVQVQVLALVPVPEQEHLLQAQHIQEPIHLLLLLPEHRIDFHLLLLRTSS